MKTINLTSLLLVAALALPWVEAAYAAGPSPEATSAVEKRSQCEPNGFTPEQFRVYIDEPTGFAFIKTPCGWKYVRRIEPERVAEAVALAIHFNTHR